MQPETKIQHLDSSIFEENGDDIDSVIKRLSITLQYYSHLDIINNDKDRDSFSVFIQERYNKLVDDFSILIKQDKKRLYDIQQSLINEGGFDVCDIMKCDFAGRHGNENYDNNNENMLDPILYFYKITMDSLHFYIFHLFDSGLRTIVTNETDDMKDNNSKEKSEYFDAAFARVSKMINDRQHVTASFSRFRTNNKFNMIVNNSNATAQFDVTSDEEGITYIDELCSYLRNKGMNDISIAAFQSIIITEEYDSEAITDEVLNDIDGCVLTIMNDKNCFDALKNFIKYTQKNMSSFSIGLRFYYWEYYKTLRKLPQNEQVCHNINDHSNYDICELYIEKKYDTFKEEIANYKYIIMKQYVNLVVVKAQICYSSETAKKIRAIRFRSRDRLHYGIEKGTPLGFQNLISIILYTDFSDLCGDFSSTFRKTTTYETISSIKARNRKYYWMSRILRETVERFGTYVSRKDLIKLPFFTGVSVVMAIPQFVIRLCAPTSTSRQKEVAIKFSGPDGMVLELKVKIVGNMLTAFDTSWISRYKEEDERLYFGGHFPITITTAIHRNTDENFCNFFGPLLYFDSMLNGTPYGRVKDINITSNEIEMISSLIQWKLGYGLKKKYPAFIYDTFDCYCKNKQQITLRLKQFKKMNQPFKNLIMHDIEIKTHKREALDKTNLIQPQILDIFENVKRISYVVVDDYCSLSLISLLSLIDPHGIEQVSIPFETNKDNWFACLAKSSEGQEWINIKAKYKEKNYKIEFKKNWIEIDKM